MTAKKKTSNLAAGKNDGKKGPGDQRPDCKMTAKKVDQDPGPIKNDGKVSQIHAGPNAKSKKNAVKYTLII